MAICIFCGGACGRVCRGLGFRLEATSKATPKSSRGGGKKHFRAVGLSKLSASDDREPARITQIMQGAGVAPGPRETNPRRKAGRPVKGSESKTLTAAAPWEAAGVSRATWYRRQAEKRGK